MLSFLNKNLTNFLKIHVSKYSKYNFKSKIKVNHYRFAYAKFCRLCYCFFQQTKNNRVGKLLFKIENDRNVWWWKIIALNQSEKNLQGDINWGEIEKKM